MHAAQRYRSARHPIRRPHGTRTEQTDVKLYAQQHRGTRRARGAVPYLSCRKNHVTVVSPLQKSATLVPVRLYRFPASSGTLRAHHIHMLNFREHCTIMLLVVHDSLRKAHNWAREDAARALRIARKRCREKTLSGQWWDTPNRMPHHRAPAIILCFGYAVHLPRVPGMHSCVRTVCLTNLRARATADQMGPGASNGTIT